MSHPLHRQARHRPPDAARARLRRTVPPAHLPAACRRRPSGTSTSCCAAPTRRASAGAGSGRTRSCSAVTAQPLGGRNRRRRARTRPRGSSRPPGQDPDWGMLVWLTMTTGARRGELCALRWSARRLGRRRGDPEPRDLAGRRAPRGEGHQDPSAPPADPRPRDRGCADRALGSVLRSCRGRQCRPWQGRVRGSAPGPLGQQPQRQRPGEPDQAVIITDEFQPVGP